MIIASSQGGVSIEDVAAETPEAITYEPIDIMTGITDEQVKRVVTKVFCTNNGYVCRRFDLLTLSLCPNCLCFLSIAQESSTKIIVNLVTSLINIYFY